MLSRRRLLASAAPYVFARAAQPKRPNIIVFMTDDHGAWANGAYGCAEMYTPNIDRLAKGGAQFTRAYAATPVCSPSRMTYLTGKMPSTHGVQDWIRPAESFGERTKFWLKGHTTFAKLLAEAGYRTGMTGKWHMGEDAKAQEGFSYWATVPGGGGPYKDVTFVKNGREVKAPGFKEDFIGDCALEFLGQKSAQPFFLYVPFYAPHTPFSYQPDEDRAHYAKSAFACFPREPRHPWQNRGLRAHHLEEESMRSYSALISGADRNVGRVLQYLREHGLENDTTVVFTADQGWNAGHHGVWGKGNGTWPFNMYEESIRVPMLWRHPGRIPAGQKRAEMISSYDLFPTILEWAGISAPPDRARPGRSYAPLLRGEKPRWDNRLFFEYSMVRAIRTGGAKLVVRTPGWPSEFYDLEADPGERRNLIDEPSRARQIAGLRAEMEQWFAGIGAPPLERWRETTSQELTEYTR
jgi:choline-sulfatase